MSALYRCRWGGRLGRPGFVEERLGGSVDKRHLTRRSTCAGWIACKAVRMVGAGETTARRTNLIRARPWFNAKNAVRRAAC